MPPDLQALKHARRGALIWATDPRETRAIFEERVGLGEAVERVAAERMKELEPARRAPPEIAIHPSADLALDPGRLATELLAAPAAQGPKQPSA